MKLCITPECIVVKIAKESEFALYVISFLSEQMARSIWVNETLMNFSTPSERAKRKIFLTKLYQLCAQKSSSHNRLFLEKLLQMCHKPIKVLLHTPSPSYNQHVTKLQPCYDILNAHPTEAIESIRKKYLYLAKKFHPDLFTCKDETVQKVYAKKFQKIQEAYHAIKKIKQEVQVA